MTKEQWYDVVEKFLRENYDLEDEEVTNITEDIVGRCFAYGVPKLHELPEYIADYMK